MANVTSLTTIVIENEDGKFLVPRYDVLAEHLLRGERWEPQYARLIPLLLAPGGTAVDVGACIGYTTVVMAKAAGGSGRVMSFEPMRLLFQQLCGTIALNGLTNVYPHNFALGHANDVTVSMVAMDAAGDSSNVMNSCIGIGGDSVTMRTLDSFELRDVSVIKIDVQGCEPYVLCGAQETIRQNRPVVLIEIEDGQLKHQNSSAIDLMVMLFSHDYILAHLADESTCDYVCIPAEKRNLIPTILRVFGGPSEVLELRNGIVGRI